MPKRPRRVVTGHDAHSVYSGGERRSYLLLPVIGGVAARWKSIFSSRQTPSEFPSMERKKRHVETHEKGYLPPPLIRTLRISDARVAHAQRDGIFPEAIEDVCPGYDDIGESDGLVVVVELQT